MEVPSVIKAFATRHAIKRVIVTIAQKHAKIWSRETPAYAKARCRQQEIPPIPSQERLTLSNITAPKAKLGITALCPRAV